MARDRELAIQGDLLRSNEQVAERQLEVARDALQEQRRARDEERRAREEAETQREVDQQLREDLARYEAEQRADDTERLRLGRRAPAKLLAQIDWARIKHPERIVTIKDAERVIRKQSDRANRIRRAQPAGPVLRARIGAGTGESVSVGAAEDLIHRRASELRDLRSEIRGFPIRKQHLMNEHDAAVRWARYYLQLVAIVVLPLCLFNIWVALAVGLGMGWYEFVLRKKAAAAGASVSALQAEHAAHRRRAAELRRDIHTGREAARLVRASRPKRRPPQAGT